MTTRKRVIYGGLAVFSAVVVAWTIYDERRTVNQRGPVSSGGTVLIDGKPVERVEPEARAARPGLTYENYERIREGMSLSDVEAILGSRGKELSRSDLAGIATIMVSWEGFGKSMNAIFQNGKLVQKASTGCNDRAP